VNPNVANSLGTVLVGYVVKNRVITKKVNFDPITGLTAMPVGNKKFNVTVKDIDSALVQKASRLLFYWAIVIPINME
jgi:hypothetical protein